MHSPHLAPNSHLSTVSSNVERPVMLTSSAEGGIRYYHAVRDTVSASHSRVHHHRPHHSHSQASSVVTSPISSPHHNPASAPSATLPTSTASTGRGANAQFPDIMPTLHLDSGALGGGGDNDYNYSRSHSTLPSHTSVHHHQHPPPSTAITAADIEDIEADLALLEDIKGDDAFGDLPLTECIVHLFRAIGGCYFAFAIWMILDLMEMLFLSYGLGSEDAFAGVATAITITTLTSTSISMGFSSALDSMLSEESGKSELNTKTGRLLTISVLVNLAAFLPFYIVYVSFPVEFVQEVFPRASDEMYECLLTWLGYSGVLILPQLAICSLQKYCICQRRAEITSKVAGIAIVTLPLFLAGAMSYTNQIQSVSVDAETGIVSPNRMPVVQKVEWYVWILAVDRWMILILMWIFVLRDRLLCHNLGTGWWWGVLGKGIGARIRKGLRACGVLGKTMSSVGRSVVFKLKRKGPKDTHCGAYVPIGSEGDSLLGVAARGSISNRRPYSNFSSIGGAASDMSECESEMTAFGKDSATLHRGGGSLQHASLLIPPEPPASIFSFFNFTRQPTAVSSVVGDDDGNNNDSLNDDGFRTNGATNYGTLMPELSHLPPYEEGVKGAFSSSVGGDDSVNSPNGTDGGRFRQHYGDEGLAEKQGGGNGTSPRIQGLSALAEDPTDASFPSLTEFKEYIIVGVPSLVSFVFDIWALELMTILAARCGAVHVAAWSLLVQTTNPIFAAAIATSVTSSVFIGAARGRGVLGLARTYSQAAVVVSFAIGTFCGLLLFIVWPYGLDVFSTIREIHTESTLSSLGPQKSQADLVKVFEDEVVVGGFTWDGDAQPQGNDNGKKKHKTSKAMHKDNAKFLLSQLLLPPNLKISNSSKASVSSWERRNTTQASHEQRTNDNSGGTNLLAKIRRSLVETDMQQSIGYYAVFQVSDMVFYSLQGVLRGHFRQVRMTAHVFVALWVIAVPVASVLTSQPLPALVLSSTGSLSDGVSGAVLQYLPVPYDDHSSDRRGHNTADDGHHAVEPQPEEVSPHEDDNRKSGGRKTAAGSAGAAAYRLLSSFVGNHTSVTQFSHQHQYLLLDRPVVCEGKVEHVSPTTAGNKHMPKNSVVIPIEVPPSIAGAGEDASSTGGSDAEGGRRDEREQQTTAESKVETTIKSTGHKGTTHGAHAVTVVATTTPVSPQPLFQQPSDVIASVAAQYCLNGSVCLRGIISALILGTTMGCISMVVDLKFVCREL